MNVRVHRWIAVLSTALSVAQAQEEVPAAAPGSPLNRFNFEIGGRYLYLVSGSVRAQGPPALKLHPRAYDLRDLGVEDGYSPFAKVSFAATRSDALSFSIFQNNLAGDVTLGRPLDFNDVRILPGAAETSVEVTVFDLLYHRRLFTTPGSAWALEGNVGFRHFAGVIHIDRSGGGGDQEELESFLVPTFGAKLAYRPSPKWEFAIEGSGSAPGDVFELADEPADIRYWRADLIATWRFSHHFHVNGGVRFADLDMDFSGQEVDRHYAHNLLRTTTVEPFLSVGFSF